MKLGSELAPGIEEYEITRGVLPVVGEEAVVVVKGDALLHVINLLILWELAVLDHSGF